jgi:ectoine hydroxylase-related dioxygenase (phytanoyl-CoA dioxygenase family)
MPASTGADDLVSQPSLQDDLSLYHHPLTGLFERPKTKAEWGRYHLNDEQLDSYRKRGYVSGIRMLDGAQVQTLRGELSKLTSAPEQASELFYEYHSNETSDPSKILFHALGAWRVSPALHDLLWNPAFLVPASQLLGGAVRFWHDQLFCKPARQGGPVSWHQDYSYWTRTEPIAHLSCWIGLDDSTSENGCVHYVPGSHRWNLLPVTGLADDMDAIHSALTVEQLEAFKPTPIELKAGEASFHHPLMVHGSYENRTENERRAVVLNVFRDGVVSASDEPPLKGVPPIRRGWKMGGQFFPLLFGPVSAL